MLGIRYHASFKKDYKRIIKRGYNNKLLEEYAIDNGELFLYLTRTGSHSDLF